MINLKLLSITSVWAVWVVAGVGCGRREVWPAKITLPAKTFEAAMEGSEGNKFDVFRNRL
jgi:hypothetical protein